MSTSLSLLSLSLSSPDGLVAAIGSAVGNACRSHTSCTFFLNPAVLICEQGGLVIANTWKGAAPTCHTPRSPDDHRIDFVAFGAKRLRSTRVVTDQIGGKSLQLTTTMDHLPVLACAPPCNRWTFDTRGPPSLRWNKQAIRWALADETIQRSFLRTIDEAFSARADLFVLPPTLSLHEEGGSNDPFDSCKTLLSAH